MSIERRRLSPEESRASALEAASAILIEAGPQGLWANDGVVVFSLGGGKIYRILLDAM